jgi:hypothetical protein
MNNEIKVKRKSKPIVSEKYKGIKKESVMFILTDENGKQTKVKL